MHFTYDQIAGAIDHALLHPTMSDGEMVKGCELAVKYQVASVCVKPYFISRAAEVLAGSSVAVGTVIGFPHGSNEPEVKRYEVELACKAGATEVDMVVNIGKVFSSDWDYVRTDIATVVTEAKKHGALTKVIFETDYLQDAETKAQLCRISEEAGAAFVKTSTGFGFVKNSDGHFATQGAIEADLNLMRSICSSAVGVKASGGVRDLDTAVRWLALGCTRIGTSSTAAILEDYLRRTSGSSGETSPKTESSIRSDY